MALANPGGPEQAPGNQRMSAGLGGRIRGRSPIMEEIASLAGREAPHHGDHGRNLFSHPSTNRGASPGTLNGEPARNPGGSPTRTTSPFNRIKNPTTEPANNKPVQRPVDITMPPTLTGDTSGTPGQGRAGY